MFVTKYRKKLFNKAKKNYLLDNPFNQNILFRVA